MSPGRLLIGATPLGQPRMLRRGWSAPWPVRTSSPPRTPGGSGPWPRRSTCKPAGKVVSLYDQNEAARVPALVAEIAAGATVLLVSDAGMPLISDPGYRLVAACVDSGPCRSPACPAHRR